MDVESIKEETYASVDDQWNKFAAIPDSEIESPPKRGYSKLFIIGSSVATLGVVAVVGILLGGLTTGLGLAVILGFPLSLRVIQELVTDGVQSSASEEDNMYLDPMYKGLNGNIYNDKD